MTLPGFLIIGAMKAGTTTLYEDLLHIPGIWLPPQKEPEDLIYPEVETPEGLAIYTRKFARCPLGSQVGDASTAYAKRPTYEGIANRALKILGPKTKIIYLTRDPVRRIISQYHHLWGLEMENRPLNQAVLEDPSYLSYSCYDWQLEPWRSAFGESQILTLRFEDYLANHATELARICRFLGVEPRDIPEGSHRNASKGKRVAREGTLMQKFSTSRLYLFGVKPLIPTELRDRIKSLVLPKARKMNDTLHEETIQHIKEKLLKDPIAKSYLK